MTTAPQNASFSQVENTQKAPLTLARLVAAVFMANLRESLDVQSSTAKADAAFRYGL